MSDRIGEQSLPRTMTAADYRNLPETNQPMELIDGAVVMSPAPIDLHQELHLNLVTWFIQHKPPGGTMRYSPADVHFDEKDVLQPDIFWVSDSNENCRLVGNYWHGAPDLVIEILSPGTEHRDRQVKFKIYQQHSVREYWMVSGLPRTIEVWRLVDERFQRLGVFNAEEAFDSDVLGGIRVELAEIFK